MVTTAKELERMGFAKHIKLVHIVNIKITMVIM
ncbi:hypothetical protein LASUN_08950 [Lentilactobacillus sunkii]|uniref:Uncharacterized protein n=1 Tax=Lentilactobacillus sunkii TaxID=481719 RepID=A0A1E7XDV4_9LACO|nr:hypothetical protein LASUN_08950 [Lentilactobacillus sunkii]